MEDKKTRELIKLAIKSGADVKVAKISSNRSESIKKILEGLNELEGDIKPETLIQYEFKISPVENLVSGSVGQAMIGYVEDISSLTKEDIISIFKPVEAVLKQCGEEFLKKLNASKRTPSPEEVRKMIDELLEDNKDVN